MEETIEGEDNWKRHEHVQRNTGTYQPRRRAALASDDVAATSAVQEAEGNIEGAHGATEMGMKR